MTFFKENIAKVIHEYQYRCSISEMEKMMQEALKEHKEFLKQAAKTRYEKALRDFKAAEQELREADVALKNLL